MNYEHGSIVWILGAGFSRPLGGPLIDTLLSESSLELIRHAYPEREYPEMEWKHLLRAVRFYHAGCGKDGKGYGLIEPFDVWSDPEKYLEALDSALQHRESPYTKRLVSYASQMFDKNKPLDYFWPEFERLCAAARRMIAAECAVFTVDAKLGEEHWKPYVRWVSETINPSDTIVTFNYDCVLERLAAWSDRLFIPAPGELHRKHHEKVLALSFTEASHGKPRQMGF